MIKIFLKIILENPLVKWFIYALKYIRWSFIFPTTKLDYGCEVRDSFLGKYSRLSFKSKVKKCILGKYSYVGENSTLTLCTVGKFTCIGPDVHINLGTHPTHLQSIHPAFYTVKLRAAKSFVNKNSFKEYHNVFIGNDVWIGARVVILGGSKVPDGVIISAGSVVRKNDKLEEYGIYGGNPISLIKFRRCKRENSIFERWWDLDDKAISESLEKFF